MRSSSFTSEGGDDAPCENCTRRPYANDACALYVGVCGLYMRGDSGERSVANSCAAGGVEYERRFGRADESSRSRGKRVMGDITGEGMPGARGESVRRGVTGEGGDAVCSGEISPCDRLRGGVDFSDSFCDVTTCAPSDAGDENMPT